MENPNERPSVDSKFSPASFQLSEAASVGSGVDIWSDDDLSQSVTFYVTPICSFRRALDKDIPEIKTLVTEISSAVFGPESVEDKIKKCYFSMVAINADSRIIAVICLNDHPNIAALPDSEWENWIVKLYKEEDNDDIISIINSHSTKIKQIYGDYYVSEILTKFPYMKRNIIVAEIPERAVGVLFINEHINYDTLIQNFNLEPYSNLHNLYTDDVIVKKRSLIAESELQLEQDTLDSMSLKITNVRATVDDGEAMDSEYLDLMDIDDELSLNEILDLEKLGIMVDDLGLDFDATTSFPETDVDKETDRIVMRRISNSDFKCNLASQSVINFELPYHTKSGFSLEVLAADEEHEQGVVCDLLEAAFQSVTASASNYCVFGALNNLSHFPLYDFFVRAIPRRNKIYPREIYVLHKNAIKATLKCNLMRKSQFGKVKSFICNINYASSLIDAITRSIYGAQQELKTYILTNISVIIGVMIIQVESNPQDLFDNYECYRYVDHSAHRYDRCGSIKYCIISPIFQKHIHFFLREVHRKADISILFFRLRRDELFQKTRTKPIAAILRDMLPVPERFLPNFKNMDLDPDIELPPCMEGDENKDTFSLFLSTKRLCSLQRIEVNSRIVVVGASCTGFSFLESLIFHFDGTRHVIFNNLFLVYDRSLKDASNVKKFVQYMFLYRGKYPGTVLNSMLYHTHVNYVNGTMTAINRKFKYITIDKESIVPYDYLLLMCGQQFHQPYANGVRRDKICESCPRNVFIINKFSDADQAFNKIFNSTRYKPNTVIIVYGSCLNTYGCLTALEKARLNDITIKLVEPIPDEFERPSMDPFNNPDIYDAFQDILYLLGVEVYTGYYFYEWEVDSYYNVVRNVKYQSRKGAISFNCDFIFHYANKEVNYETFTAINSAGLVYDGKLVINPDCRTNDPFIFAAGPMTKYSRRYFADRFLHKYYNSQEIGGRLGKQIRSMTLPGGLAANEGDPIFDILNNPDTNKLVPQYTEPVLLNCVLPSGINYLDIHSPGKPLPLETRRFLSHVFETGNLKQIELNEDPGYFRLQLDQNMRVEQIVCFTRRDIDVTHYQRLWGKHEQKLNNLVHRFKKGMISDLYQFFRNPYFCALYVDTFSDLQARLERILTLLTTKKGKSIIEDIVQKLIKNNWRSLTASQEEEVTVKLTCSPYHQQMVIAIMEFLEEYTDYFPMYAHPLITKIILHDVESSPLFQLPRGSGSTISDESNG